MQSFSDKKIALFHFWTFVFRYGFSTETKESSVAQLLGDQWTRGCYSNFPQEAYFVDLLHGCRANPIPPISKYSQRTRTNETSYQSPNTQLFGVQALSGTPHFFQILVIHSVLFFGQYQKQTATVCSTKYCSNRAKESRIKVI